MNIPILAAGLFMSNNYLRMRPLLILMVVIATVLIASSIIFTYLTRRIRMTPSEKKIQSMILMVMYVTTLLVVVCSVVCFIRYRSVSKQAMDAGGQNATFNTIGNTNFTGADSTENTTLQTEDITPVPDPTFTPQMSDSSNPEHLGIKWEIAAGDKKVDSFQRSESISFGAPDDYFALPGIATFRGNNFRNSASYGTANVTENTLTQLWSRGTGTLNGWPGSGWTGQPLMVQWDAETKAIMNMYPEKKSKENLVEVIYATLDGNIYFYDLDDGSYTRNPINVGMNFKGAGSLDPRGYPIMYVGSGDYLGSKKPRMYIISLIDGTILYEGKNNDSFSSRNNWSAFDSGPLVDAQTDTLIWPCENGVLYTVKLNTHYDKAAGTLTIQPEDIAKTRYSTKRSNSSTWWVGYEASAAIVDRYLYISENGGMFFCVDLDTMELVWAQDTLDDSNSTPVFEWNGLDGGYIYTAPSLHWTSRNGKGYICIYKLDAKTGEIVWEKQFDCHTVDGISGGVQSTPLLGKPGTDLEGLIIYPVARCPNPWSGRLVALDTQTGEIVWEKPMDFYSWSSPVAVYNEAGNGYVIVCDSNGNMSLLNAKGTTLSTINLGSNIEASPAVFNDTLVVGTRGNLICGVKIK